MCGAKARRGATSGCMGFIHGFQCTEAALSDDATGGFSAIVSADNTVTSGQTYYYATTAVGSTGLESSYSNVAQAVILPRKEQH